MKNRIFWFLLGALIGCGILFHLFNNEFIRIRSDVIYKTGYDISYPKEWKGTCR